MMKTNLGLYIHIPFCEKKCLYCDFNSNISSYELRKNYTESLINEINRESKKYKNNIVDTIFIGGGTPSVLEEVFIEDIINEIYNNFKISKNLEFTIEGNPNSLTLKKLRLYKNLGINRLSIGAQSFSEKEIKALGRIHTREDIFKAVENGRNLGFENISLDLMIGIPYENINTFKKTIMEAIGLDVEHISAYSLILEKNTPLYNMKKSGVDLNLPSEDEEREIYRELLRILEKNGYKRYEISNFSKPGFESKHNLKYWNWDDYLGLGLGSHSKIKDFRFENISDIKKYINNNENNKSVIINKYKLDNLDKINEIIIMGLRKAEGFNYEKLNKKFNLDFLREYDEEINKNLKNGYIEIKGDFIRLTDKGLDFSNLVELDFYRL